MAVTSSHCSPDSELKDTSAGSGHTAGMFSKFPAASVASVALCIVTTVSVAEG